MPSLEGLVTGLGLLPTTENHCRERQLAAEWEPEGQRQGPAQPSSNLRDISVN